PRRSSDLIIDTAGVLPRLKAGILFSIIIQELYLQSFISRVALVWSPQENTAVAAFREPVLQLQLKIIIGLGCGQPSAAALRIKHRLIGMPAASIASYAGPAG